MRDGFSDLEFNFQFLDVNLSRRIALSTRLEPERGTLQKGVTNLTQVFLHFHQPRKCILKHSRFHRGYLFDHASEIKFAAVSNEFRSAKHFETLHLIVCFAHRGSVRLRYLQVNLGDLLLSIKTKRKVFVTLLGPAC